MHSEDFSSLMQYRIIEILLVASHYDSFILEEDGQLTELVIEEYRNLDLNLRFAPRFTRASEAAEAIELIKNRDFDMVITTPRMPDMEIGELVHTIKQINPKLPVGLIAAHAWELPWLEDVRASGDLDWTFLWQGNVQALLAMIKQVEDRRNAEHDIMEGGVQAIILVEDEPRFYSIYLPHFYTEITSQTRRLMSEGMNLSHRLLRIRARPKILLAQTYEEAWELYERYAGNILGIITDVSFPRGGKLDHEAGIRLAERVRYRDEDTPDPDPIDGSEHDRKGPRGGRRVHEQKIASPARRSAPVHPRPLRFRRLRLQASGRLRGHRGHPGCGRCSGAWPRSPRSRGLPRQPQPFFRVAQGAHRVRARNHAATAQGHRVCLRLRAPQLSRQDHHRLSARDPAARHHRFRRQPVQRVHGFRQDRIGLPRRQGARPRLHAQDPRPRGPRHRQVEIAIPQTVVRGVRCLRRVPRGQRAARFRHPIGRA